MFNLGHTDQQVKLLGKKIYETFDMAEKVKKLYEDDERTEFNLAMRYAMYSYFPGYDTDSARELCEGVVQKAIKKVKYTQLHDSPTSGKSESGKCKPRLDTYQKTALNRW